MLKFCARSMASADRFPSVRCGLRKSGYTGVRYGAYRCFGLGQFRPIVTVRSLAAKNGRDVDAGAELRAFGAVIRRRQTAIFRCM
jgi:hypothetical protein